HQPLQHGIGVDLEHPRCAPDAHAFGQARQDAHDELDRHPFAMEEGAEGLEKGATTDHTPQLPPGTTIGMAIGAEMAPADPAPRGTVRVRAEVHRGVDLAAAPPGGEDGGWRRCGGWRAGGGGGLTGVAVRLLGESRKRFGLAAALWQW